MRTTSLVTIGLLLALVCLRTTASDPVRSPETATVTLEHRFRDTVRPFLETYCLGCHGKEKPKGDLDLSVYTTADAVAKDLAQWEVVLEQLKRSDAAGEGEATSRATRPSGVVDWIQAIRKHEAKRNAGDPGRVPARRLSNAEYDYTIRDLTGVDLRPTREFPVDPANEAGFDNSAESLTMSPALVKKYLEAARLVADHLVLKPQGFAFASLPGGRRHRSRQVLRAPDHRFLQAAADRLRRLFPGRLAVPASARHSAGRRRRWPTSPPRLGSAPSTWRRSGRS